MRKVVLTIILAATVLGMALAPVQAARASGGYCTQYHVIQRGENLFRIARHYGTTVAALQSLNNIANVNRIYAGQTLCVQTAPVETVYVVQRGDTLFRIAQRFGVNMYTLAQRNNITNINRIYAGQVLYVPSGWGW
jgi:LysM repeat protein